MPIYTFENTKTGEVFDDMMTISEKETYLKQNPNIKKTRTNDNSAKRNDRTFRKIHAHGQTLAAHGQPLAAPGHTLMEIVPIFENH